MPTVPSTGHCNAELDHSQICLCGSPGAPPRGWHSSEAQVLHYSCQEGIFLIWGAQIKDQSSDKALWEHREERAPEKQGNRDAEQLQPNTRSMNSLFEGSPATPAAPTSKAGPLCHLLTHPLPSLLTCLHQDELGGLLPDAVHSSAVVVPKVILRVWGHLWGEGRLKL